MKQLNKNSRRYRKSVKIRQRNTEVTKPLPDTFSNISTVGVSTYVQDISTNQEFEKNQPTTCKVCLKKAYDNYETAWPTKCTCDDGWKPWPPSKSLQYDPYSYANIIMKTDDEGSIKWWRHDKAD